MREIKHIHLEKYDDPARFKPIGGGAYRSLADDNFKVALSFTLEEGENTQYPMEDIMDKYFVNATDFMEVVQENGATVFRIELETLDDDDDSLESIRTIAAMAGRRVYYNNGLVIE
ncbi:MAG: hypothetical protein LBB75_02495 [Oscillospiraceae bacterium]|jgi:hypothetical protein|nr:hypothetical protein [Oscillospiraceae bacterium]